MRQTLPLLALVAVVATPVLAQRSAVPPQIDRGSFLLAGGASFSHTRTEVERIQGSGGPTTQRFTSLSVSPSLLFFVAPRFAIGGQLGLGYGDSESGSSTTLGIGPAARLYFAGTGARALPYIGLSVLAERVSFDDDDSDASSDASQWGPEGVAGINWMLSRQVGITGEAFLGRRAASFEQSEGAGIDQTTTSFGLRFGLAAFLPRGR